MPRDVPRGVGLSHRNSHDARLRHGGWPCVRARDGLFPESPVPRLVVCDVSVRPAEARDVIVHGGAERRARSCQALWVAFVEAVFDVGERRMDVEER